MVELLDSDDEDVATPAPRRAAPASQTAAAHQESGPSESAPNDGSVAQLVDMGFTPEQAASVRQPPLALSAVIFSHSNIFRPIQYFLPLNPLIYFL